MSGIIMTRDIDYEQIVDQIDALLAEAFNTSHLKNTDDNMLRYWLLVPLLRGWGDYMPGLSVDSVRNAIEKAIGAEISVVDESSNSVTGLLSALIRPTYTAVSYWSPLDGLRHTITHRPDLASAQEKRNVLAHAYAFYALTHVGIPHSLYSIVQFISEGAVIKRGIRVCYKDESEVLDEGADWWHIPLHLHDRILDQTGIAHAIHDTFLKDGRISNEELDEFLGKCLVNIQSPQHGWIDVDSFASKFIHRFRGTRNLNLSPEIADFVEKTRNYLSSFFSSPIRFDQALFMLMTHILYTKACPTDYIYTYPVRVARTCCVLTVGTDQVLDHAHNLALGSVAKSIFTHPLLLDFTAKEANARLEAETNALWKSTIDMARHRIGNPLLNIRMNLKSIGISIDEGDTQEAKIILGDLDYSASKIKMILDDIGRYLKFEEIDQIPVSLGPIVKRLCETARRKGFQCEAECPAGTVIFGNANSLDECFDELLANSMRWCREEPKVIEINVADADSSQLPTGLDRNKRFVQVHFQDNGPGVSDDLKRKIFEPLFTTHAEGNGMGLAWVNRKVKQHLGTVSEVGLQGKGADFLIFLPRYDSMTPDVEAATSTPTEAEEIHNAEDSNRRR